eukprot:gene27018-2244_t
MSDTLYGGGTLSGLPSPSSIAPPSQVQVNQLITQLQMRQPQGLYQHTLNSGNGAFLNGSGLGTNQEGGLGLGGTEIGGPPGFMGQELHNLSQSIQPLSGLPASQGLHEHLDPQAIQGLQERLNQQAMQEQLNHGGFPGGVGGFSSIPGMQHLPQGPDMYHHAQGMGQQQVGGEGPELHGSAQQQGQQRGGEEGPDMHGSAQQQGQQQHEAGAVQGERGGAGGAQMDLEASAQEQAMQLQARQAQDLHERLRAAQTQEMHERLQGGQTQDAQGGWAAAPIPNHQQVEEPAGQASAVPSAQVEEPARQAAAVPSAQVEEPAGEGEPAGEHGSESEFDSQAEEDGGPSEDQEIAASEEQEMAAAAATMASAVAEAGGDVAMALASAAAAAAATMNLRSQGGGEGAPGAGPLEEAEEGEVRGGEGTADAAPSEAAEEGEERGPVSMSGGGGDEGEGAKRDLNPHRPHLLLELMLMTPPLLHHHNPL